MRLIQSMTLVAVVLMAAIASADTIHVCWDGSGDYETIQEGIDAAQHQAERGAAGWLGQRAILAQTLGNGLGVVQLLKQCSDDWSRLRPGCEQGLPLPISVRVPYCVPQPHPPA